MVQPSYEQAGNVANSLNSIEKLFGGSSKQVTYDTGASFLGGVQGWNPYMQAIDRLFTSDSSPAAIQSYGIFDQSRYWNDYFFGQQQQAIQAGGRAQEMGFDRARMEASRFATAGYQRAEDYGVQMQGQLQDSLASSGLFSTTANANLTRAVGADTLRRYQEVDSSLAQLYSQIELGRGSAQADTYNRLAGLYENQRATAEQSFMNEFNARIGYRVDPRDLQPEQGNGLNAILGSVLGGLAASIPLW